MGRQHRFSKLNACGTYDMLRPLKQQEALLSLEYEHEKREYEELCRQTGIRKRIRQGKCRFPVGVGRTYYNVLDQLVVEILTSDSSEEENPDADFRPDKEMDREFEPGRPVVFFYASSPEGDTDIPQFLPYTCQVSRTEGNRLQITLPGTAAAEVLRDHASRGLLGVQTAFDATSFRVMRDALRRLQETEDRKLVHLRNVLLGLEKPSFRVGQPVRFPWLNASQEAAVQKVLCAREVAVVHGPPGTGKTTTLIEAIGETLRREAQVLVCAQSNAAVDWISEQLMARGIPVLRIGNPMRVSDALLAATYERRYEAHPDYAELWSIRKELRLLLGLSRKSLSATERRGRENRIDKLRSRANELEIRIREELFASARVVACTLIGTASRVLERRHFSSLFIDEAAQAFEAACWAAILKADRVIFAGDHKQLPPTIKCREAETAGLGCTLMEKVARRFPECVQLLTVQYRMNEDIMAFSNFWFYGGHLQAAPEIARRTVLPLEYPLVWMDTSALGFEEEENSYTQSRLNTAEARLLVHALCRYVERVGVDRLLEARTDFGIISPYKSQVHLLRRLIKASGLLKPLRSFISVDTVDGFQGQERDVIFISMVRGNDEGRIGFLNDLRRMNVAITRARMKLVIFGDAATLSHTEFYRRLVAHVTERGKRVPLQPEADDAAEF